MASRHERGQRFGHDAHRPLPRSNQSAEREDQQTGQRDQVAPLHTDHVGVAGRRVSQVQRQRDGEDEQAPAAPRRTRAPPAGTAAGPIADNPINSSDRPQAIVMP